MKIPKGLKNITNKEYIHEDFDKDKTPNVDDSYPFDPNRSKSVQEESLSKELKALERLTQRYEKPTREVARKLGTPHYRIKGTYSLIGKLRRIQERKHFVADIGGVRVIKETHDPLHKEFVKAKKIYAHRKFDISDYYKYPKDKGYYMAKHLSVKQRGIPIEVQFKTPPMQALHDIGHPYHKKRKLPPLSLRRKARELYKAGF